jgi:hypothetical protein
MIHRVDLFTMNGLSCVARLRGYTSPPTAALHAAKHSGHEHGASERMGAVPDLFVVTVDVTVVVDERRNSPKWTKPSYDFAWRAR